LGSLYAALPKPPSALSLTVRKLIGRVQEGAIRVPSFQRPLRWRADDVVKLFDSVLRGYPIGSLLFWKHPFDADHQLIVGNALLPVPAVADGWFIVDGQQRVTALAASLLDLDQRGDPRWDVRFDPSVDAFRSDPASPDEARRHVPLRTLGDLRRLGRWFPDCNLSEVEKSRVEEVQQRLLDYEIPGYVVETDDMDALKGVFARLNSTGVRMRADEVFQALLGQDAGAKSQRRSIHLGALQKAADLDGFGEPSRTEVLKALLAMSGLDPSKRLEDLGEDAVEKLVGEADSVEAIGRAVAFLAAPPSAAEPGAGIPAYAFLPYPVVFVLLARWFHLFPESDETTRRALVRWLWRGVVTGVHQRAAVSAMRFQVKVIEAGDMTGSIARLLDAVGEPAAHEWVLDPFHASHAASRVEILALLEREPCDLDGPVSWRALLTSGDRVAREIFRVARIEDRALHQQLRTAANRVLLDAKHTDLKTELRRWEWGEHRDALESHLIDEEGLAELHRNDTARFLERRGSRLRTVVSSFVARRADLGSPRLLPVESYYEGSATQSPDVVP
jgi:hypothetical protein